jgi:hypothetical protein
VYPQGNPPDSWQQYSQQPDPYAAYGPPPQPMPQYPEYQYPEYSYQQPGGFPGQPYPAPVQGRRSGSRTPLIIVGVVVGVIVLVCAAGVALVALGAAVDDGSGTDRAGAAGSAAPPASTQAAAPPTPGATTPPTEESIEGDLAKFKVGDCLTITGTENSVNPAKCTDSGAYKVLLRRDGTTDEDVCDSTDATDVLYQDGVGTSRDLVLCVAPAT